MTATAKRPNPTEPTSGMTDAEFFLVISPFVGAIAALLVVMIGRLL